MDYSGYDYIRFSWADLNGISRGKIVTRVHLNDALQNGLACFSGLNGICSNGNIVPLPHVDDKGYGNMVIHPVENTLFPVSWSNQTSFKTAEVLCETFWTDGRPQGSCSRYLARKQLEALGEIGYDLFSGFEREFIVYRNDIGETLSKDNAFLVNLPFFENEEFLYLAQSKLQQAGINIATMHAEDSPGQFEFALTPEYGLRSADNVFRLKEALKEIGSKQGYKVTFMAKPLSRTCNTFHFNHSLHAKKCQGSSKGESSNVFYDASSPDHMSDVYRWWLGGLVTHGAALTALCSPTVNCYRFLHGPWAPSKINWGIDHRYCAFRVKTQSPNLSYIENRLSTGSANPYLVLAGTVAAGLDGIKKQISCPPEVDPAAREVPYTLAEALKALEADSVMMEALGSEFFQWFKIMKENELKILKDSNVKDDGDVAGFQKERELYIALL